MKCLAMRIDVADNQHGRSRSRTEDSNAIENANSIDLKTAKHTGLINNSAHCTPLLWTDVIVVLVTVALSRLRHGGR